jgi:SNF2 family DNA or RNA helicase
MTTYRYKTTPYVHQVKALKKLLKNGWGGALLMEPRTGKTKVAIDYMSILHMAGHVNRVVVVCPAGVMGVWEEEIPVHIPDNINYRITMWDKKGRKNSELPKFGKDVLDIVIVNYDAGSTPADWRRNRRTGEIARFVKEGRRNVEVLPGDPRWGEATRLRAKNRGGRYNFKTKLLAWQPQAIFLDESHRIKTPSATKTRTFVAIGAKIPYRVIMTGTVVTKKKRIHDVYSQWRFLNPKRFVDDAGMPMTSQEFKDHFSEFTTRRGYPQWLRNKNENQLHKLMHKDAFSVLREDCFDMPPITSQIVPVELDESAQAYDQMAEDMVARIKTGEITEASIALVQSLRLRQLSGGVARTTPTEEHPKGRLRVIGSEKLKTLEDRLEDLMEAGEHVIIGAAFRPDITRIRKLCAKRKWKHFVVQGGVPVPERMKMRREFENFPDGAVFIGQPAAASEGIDLRSAAIMIWYSLPTSWVHYRQFMDRNALHSGPRFVEYLLAGGADYLTYETLLEDGEVGKMMITSPKRLLRESRS